MAGRTEKRTVSYFPHHVDEEAHSLFIFEKTWGNDGYSAYFKLLEQMARTKDHYYRAHTDERMLYLAAKMSVDPAKAKVMIETLVKMGTIDKELWEKDRGIWMPKFVKSLEKAYEKRKNPLPTRPEPQADGSNSGSEMPIPGSEIGKKGTEKPKKAKKVKKTFPVSGAEVMLADLLLQNIREINPNFKQPDIMSWATEIDLMIRVDKRPTDEIRRVIDFLKTDEFWRAVILSTRNLKKKYDQLYMKMEKKNGSQSRQGAPSPKGQHYPEADVEA